MTRLTWFLVAAILCAAFHQTILQSLARVLIVDEGGQACNGLLVLGGDRCFEAAGEMHSRDVFRDVLLFEDTGRNLVKFGIIEPWHEMAHHQLTKHGIPAEAISTIEVEEGSMWEAIDSLCEWMKRNDTAQVRVLARQFRSRCVRDMLDDVLNASMAERVHVVGLPDRRFNDTNWWRNRLGIKVVMNSLLTLGHIWCSGRPPPECDRWDPIRYEQQLRDQVAGRQ